MLSLRKLSFLPSIQMLIFRLPTPQPRPSNARTATQWSQEAIPHVHLYGHVQRPRLRDCLSPRHTRRPSQRFPSGAAICYGGV